jgi:hypothetical protein
MILAYLLLAGSGFTVTNSTYTGQVPRAQGSFARTS